MGTVKEEGKLYLREADDGNAFEDKDAYRKTKKMEVKGNLGI